MSRRASSAAPMQQARQLAPLPYNVAGLVDRVVPAAGLDSLVLSPRSLRPLEQFLLERRGEKKLAAAGLEAARRLLLCGPPGTGKTSVASAIAFELEAELLTVRLSGTVAGHLGETGANLSKAIDALRVTDAILFLDEADAVAAKRTGDSAAANKERDLVVNSLLQELDRNKAGCVIAATNLPEHLDSAFVRRFDVLCGFDLPTAKEAADLARSRLALVPGASAIDWLHFGEQAERRGLSHADVISVAVAAAKAAVLAGREISAQDVVTATAFRSVGT